MFYETFSDDSNVPARLRIHLSNTDRLFSIPLTYAQTPQVRQEVFIIIRHPDSFYLVALPSLKCCILCSHLDVPDEATTAPCPRSITAEKIRQTPRI